MKAIVLTRGRIATVDDEDFDRVNQFKWHAFKQGLCYYGCRNIRLPNGKRGAQFLHNFILGVKGVDHRDGDGLNNLRENLRRATQQQNLRSKCRKAPDSTSKYRGVSKCPAARGWQARIYFDQQDLHLGVFSSEESAARAYDVAAKKLFGDFAAPNFP